MRLGRTNLTISSGSTLFAEAAGWAAEQTLDSAVRWLQHDEAAPPLALCVHNLPPTP
ncbi:MAG: hypothetical protein ACOYNY_23410 [Caldilineaceae bacterium]